MFPLNFINAGKKYATLDEWVPAPYFRRTFQVDGEISEATIIICGLGFYELHMNGKNITKGHIAPYRSNHDHYIYYDEYEIEKELVQGKNVVAILLGNGMQNPMGGYIWEFEKATWRSSPQVSFIIQIKYKNGKEEVVFSDRETKTAPSPIIFDDLHYGEYYDARLEVSGWNEIEYDDAKWDKAHLTVAPHGEPRRALVEPIVVRNRWEAISIVECGEGFVYDFGVNTAGVCTLSVKDTFEGQKILLQYFETLVDGKPYFDNFRYNRDRIDRYQEDIYYCAGKEVEEFTPHFTYHGFRYVYVTGITKEQATQSLLTCLEMSSDIEKIGTFECSDDTANRIQEAVMRSNYSNFFYFPTDCPQREKNGWTADVALSAEQMLLNLAPERSYEEWMRNVYKAMNEDGAIPGIVPTPGWGYEWGNGPAWDCVLVYVPYYTYKYRGNRQMLEECAVPLVRYLSHLYMSLDENDLMEIGLGDYCQAGRKNADYLTPLIVTDSIMTVDIAKKAEFIFGVLGLKTEKQYARTLANRVLKAIREHLIDENLVVKGDTQTAQAMALYYNIFTEEEKEQAFAHLLSQIEREDGHIGTGVLGGKVIFRVLSENGRSDLAYHMIVRPDFPSYGNWIARGATTLWEAFLPEGESALSMNHQFWGDVSAWFYYYPGGLRLNPTGRDIYHINVEPQFIDALDYAVVSHHAVTGEIKISWNREKEGITLEIVVPESMYGSIALPEGYVFEQGKTICDVRTGVYKIILKG